MPTRRRLPPSAPGDPSIRTGSGRSRRKVWWPTCSFGTRPSGASGASRRDPAEVGTPRTDEICTQALRVRRPEVLVRGFAAQVAHLAATGPIDPRDEMLDLAALVDCARRIEQDPAELLGPVAAAGPPWLAELFAHFVRRTDVTLAVFGWSIVDTPDGPAYRFAWPRWDPPQRPPAI